MASPFKRLCCQTARQSLTRPHITLCRAFSSTTPTHRADVSSADNEFITTFPSSTTSESHLDPVYEDDDLSSLAHAELDQHRELREMVRLAAWEMPLLGSLHKPFKPPKLAEQPLKWRYTTYMGEQHPAASKVVVEFRVKDLTDMTEAQRLKLCKIAGVRYNPLTGTIKLSCESFETQAQNKRFLGDTIAKLIVEAKDPNADTFSDIPLDTRHVKQKPQLRFPREWLLTEERKAELDGLRRQSLLEEGAKVEAQKLVSGIEAIEAARQRKLEEVEEPVMVEARQSLPKGKMGRREMGQTRGAQRP